MQTYNVGDVVAVLLNGKFRKGKVLLIAQSGFLVDISGFHLGFNADDLQLWEDFLIDCMSIEEQLPSELRLSSEQLNQQLSYLDISLPVGQLEQVENVENVEIVLNEIPLWVIETIPISFYCQHS